MANNFKPWVDSPTAGQQVQSASVFATDAQRVDGFKAGDPASALRVNSALRQANIVVAGLMQMCDDIKTLPDGLSLMSTVTQVKNAIKAAIDQLDATVLASAKSYTDTREGVINGKLTDKQNQITSNKNRLDALEPRVDYLEDEVAALSGGGGDSPYYIKGTIEIAPVYSDYFSFNIQSIVHGNEIANSVPEMQAMILDISQKLQNNENLSMMYCGTLNVGGNSDTVTFPLSVYRESSTTLTIGGRAQTEDGGFQGSRVSVDISCRLSANSSSIVLVDRMCSATPTTYFGRLPLIAGHSLNTSDVEGYGFDIGGLANLGLIPAPLENNIYEITIPYLDGMDMQLDIRIAGSGQVRDVFSNSLPQTSYTLRLYGNSQFDHNGDGTIRAEFIAMRDGNVGSPSNIVTGISFGGYNSWDSVAISLGLQGNVFAYMRVTPIVLEAQL